MKTIILFTVILKIASYLTFAQNIAIDPWTSDDHEDFDLYEIITMSEASLDADPDDLTDEEREEAVRIHNTYRGNFTGPIPSGSDVQYMEYNKSLEHAARLYAHVCVWAHGRHPNDTIGHQAAQNLYTGPTRGLARAIHMYYTEYPLYSYDDNECINHSMCSHFVVLMWGRTNQIGCARTRCQPLGNDYFSACHYWPKGNLQGHEEVKIYQIGRPCSRNPRGDGNLCYKNLCVNKTLAKKYNLDTTCESYCQNCAVHNLQKCTCECKVGWDFGDCAEPCTDLYKTSKSEVKQKCNKPYKCDNYRYYPWCRQFCGFCEAINPKKPPSDQDMCCGGKMCDRFHVLNNKCECKLLCPSRVCLFNVTEINSYSSRPNFKRLFLIIMLFAYYVFETFVS